MRRLSIVSIVLSLLLTVVARPTNAQSDTNLTITSVMLGESSITIKGKNFGSTAPKVTIGDLQLNVAQSSSTEIVTALPPLAAGVHEIQVTRDGSTTPDGTAKTTLLVP